ncbi:MAG: hypothetical protein H6668_04345 [Ardenticatenaceae bacterium]|nr:hypothetical protein [Ardenticatenaceae bacterium]
MNIGYRYLSSLVLAGLWLSFVSGCQPSEQLATIETNQPNTLLPTATSTLPSSPPLSNLATPTFPGLLVSKSEMTPIPSAALAQVSETQTPELETRAIGKLFFYRYEYYGWFDLVGQGNDQDFTLDASNEYHRYSSSELIAGPGQSTYLVFSHYSNQMAFWKGTELWISDVTYYSPQQVLIDGDSRYVPTGEQLSPSEYINLKWSPDDLYLFIYHNREPLLNLFYNVHTGQLQPWYWQCNTLILSPRSGRLASLCPKIPEAAVQEADYAVLEWGGEIWFTDVMSTEPFLNSLPNDIVFWQWSADGEWVAYFDPTDPEGYVMIASANGTVRKLLPGISLFSDSKIEGYQQYELADNEVPFLWSRDASLLLVEGWGQQNHPCPSIVSETFSPTQEMLDWSCWQAIEVASGNIIWSEGSLAEALSMEDDTETLTSMGINNVAIDPNGQFLALRTSHPEARVVIVHLTTGQVTTISRFDRFREMYWESLTD